MNKPIQVVTFSNAPAKITEDVSARQNADKEGVQFAELLSGEEAASTSSAQVHDSGSGTGGGKPDMATTADSGPDEPAATALEKVQQLAEPATSLTQVAQSPESVRATPPTQLGQASQPEQLPLPGIQTAGVTGPDATAEGQNVAAVQMTEAGSAVPVEQGAPEEHLPPVTVVNARSQPGTPLPAEPAGIQATPATPATPVIPVPASADAGVRELPLPEPVTVMARNGQQAIAAALGGQAGAKQLLADGRNTATLKADVIAPGAAAETGMTEFATTLTEAGVKSASARVAVPVGQPGWGRAVGEQVVWFVSQNINSANLRLNPQHLGPLEMQVSLDGSQANVTFTSQHAVVREALESALPRLREMLADNGLNLANVNVSQHNSPEQRGQGAFGTAQAGADGLAAQGEPDAEAEPGLPSPATTLLGLVDTYA